MAAASPKGDIFRQLTFGIKKRKSKKATLPNKDEGKKLRLRVLDEEEQVEESVDAVPHFSEQSRDQDPQIDLGLGLTLKKKGERATDKSKTLIAHKEKVKKIRKMNRIYTWGDDIADPLIHFCDIPNIPSILLSNLSEFDINEPTPIQMQAIPLMIKGRELLVSAPTGSGKTLAFAIPIILKVLQLKKLPRYQRKSEIIALVLEPTKELANQVFVQFLKFSQNLSVKCALMENDEIPKDVDVVISTPNRVAVIVENSPEVLYFGKLRWLVVDESDRLFDTTEGGERSFRSQLAKVYRACGHSKFVQHAFFSATFSYEVEEWSKANLSDVAIVCVGQRNTAAGSVVQELVFTGTEQGKVIALRSLLQQGFHPPALIFVQKKDRARQLLSEIESFDPPISVALISSEKSEKERSAAISSFREGRIWVLVCTELLGRGLDLKGVNLVVNFDLPTSVTSYIHRIGRTGRAGRRGRAITYFTQADLKFIRPIATVIRQAGFAVPEYTLQMRKLSRNDKKLLLRRPPRRKNIGVIKKRKRRGSFTKDEGGSTTTRFPMENATRKQIGTKRKFSASKVRKGKVKRTRKVPAE